MLSFSIFFRCQYILAFTNEPSDIILSSNSETRYLLLQSFMGELKIFLIVRFKKVFHFQNLCVSILSEICLALHWLGGTLACSCVRGLDIGAGINRELFLTKFWAVRGKTAAEENCEVRKVFAEEKNGSDDESPDFGPAQEYERVSERN